MSDGGRFRAHGQTLGQGQEGLLRRENRDCRSQRGGVGGGKDNARKPTEMASLAYRH